MNKRKIIISIIIITVYIFSIFLSISNYLKLSLILNVIGSLMSVYILKNLLNNYSNMLLLFYGFSILYGVSGPVSVLWGNGLPSNYGTNFMGINMFLIGYSISNIAILLGVTFYFLTHVKKDEIYYNSSIDYIYENRNKLLNIALTIALLAFIFEIVNFIRVGGISTLISGKATYQSHLSNLTLTLPSENFTEIGIALLSVYISISNKKNKKLNIKKIALFTSLISPYIFIITFLGRRGNLIGIMLIFIMGWAFFNPIKKVSLRLFITIFFLYFLMAFLYANRAIASTIITEPEFFIKNAFNSEKILKALNPSSSEFGAAFGNFNTFYINTEGSFDLLLGKSYLIGLLLPIPSFLYPGDKPKQITYIFRDLFFAFESKRGAIAGTAFSSILEAYWNFGILGIILIYFIIGYIFILLEKKIKYKSPMSSILYLSMVPSVMSFHRSAMGDLFSNLIINLLIIFIFIYLRQIPFNDKHSLENN